MSEEKSYFPPGFMAEMRRIADAFQSIDRTLKVISNNKKTKNNQNAI